MYLRWLALVMLGIVVTLLNILLAPIIALFIRDSGYLPRWLSWFQTQDNPAYGDSHFHTNEMAWALWMPDWLFLYVCGIVWAIRNPGYGYDNWAGVTIAEQFAFTQTPEHNLEWIGDELHGIELYRATARFVEGTHHRRLEQDGKEYFEFWWVKRWGGHFTRIKFGWFLDSTERYPIQSGQRRNIQMTISPWLRVKNDFL